VLARIHQAYLLSERTRLAAVKQMAALAIKTPDAGWLQAPAWQVLLKPAERARLMGTVRTELVLSARVSRAVDHRELPCRPGRRAVPRLPRCHDRPRQTPRPPAPDGPGGGPFREHVAEWGGSAASSLLLSLGEYHRTGDISPVRGFKSRTR
jgi:hypothetical protein